MKKILLMLVILITIYILIVFKVPELWKSLGELFWTTNFNEFILKHSDTFNKTVTDIPTKDELIDTYNKAYSWAIDIKDNVIDWAETVKSTIDDIRVTLSWAEDKINNVKDKYDQAKDFIDSNSWRIQELQNSIDNIREINDSLNNTWTTN